VRHGREPATWSACRESVEANLGVTRVPDNYDTLPWRTGAGTTIFAPFKEDNTVDPEVYPNGRFGRLTDPEGNPIQLWQPGGKDPGP
jgi:glyoxylase I family protein